MKHNLTINSNNFSLGQIPYVKINFNFKQLKANKFFYIIISSQSIPNSHNKSQNVKHMIKKYFKTSLFTFTQIDNQSQTH